MDGNAALDLGAGVADQQIAKGVQALRNRLNWYERLIIGHEAAGGMRALGYSK